MNWTENQEKKPAITFSELEKTLAEIMKKERIDEPTVMTQLTEKFDII